MRNVRQAIVSDNIHDQAAPSHQLPAPLPPAVPGAKEALPAPAVPSQQTPRPDPCSLDSNDGNVPLLASFFDPKAQLGPAPSVPLSEYRYAYCPRYIASHQIEVWQFEVGPNYKGSVFEVSGEEWLEAMGNPEARRRLRSRIEARIARRGWALGGQP